MTLLQSSRNLCRGWQQNVDIFCVISCPQAESSSLDKVERHEKIPLAATKISSTLTKEALRTEPFQTLCLNRTNSFQLFGHGDQLTACLSALSFQLCQDIHPFSVLPFVCYRASGLLLLSSQTSQTPKSSVLRDSKWTSLFRH